MAIYNTGQLINSIKAAQVATQKALELKNSSSPHYSKIEVYKSNVDALVLSCTLQRINSEGARGIGVYSPEVYSIQSDPVYEHVSAADVERAETVRKFYQQRIMMWKLSGVALSQFRSDLESFIVTDGKCYDAKQMGMITRLPYFYDYDTAVQAIRDEHFSENIPLPRVYNAVHTLYPVDSLIRKTKNYNRTVYWFNLNNAGVGVSYSVDKHNPLHCFFKSLFEMRRPMVLNANLEPSMREGFQHYVLTKIHSAVPA